MQILDNDSSVLTWTKKHGVKIPYELQGVTRRYVPDFHQKNVDLTEILTEIKGRMDDEAIVLKREVLEEYCHEKGINSSFIDAAGLTTLLESVGLMFSSVYAECRANVKSDKNFYLNRHSDDAVI